MNYLSNSFAIQLRVIFALMMREIHTLYGKTKLGYLWAIIITAIGIGIMWLLRSLLHFSPPHGLSLLTFLVVGFVLFQTIRDCVTKCMVAIESNKTLLSYPQVTPVDIMIARCIILLCTEIISGLIIIFVGIFFGYNFYVTNAGGILFVIFISYFLSLGIGMILSSLKFYLPILERVVPIIFRFLFFTSAVFFEVSKITRFTGDWILWNPILQLIEYARTCLSWGYPSDFVSKSYLIQLTIYSLALGFLLEKYTRKRILL